MPDDPPRRLLPVLREVLKGKRNKEIAAELSLEVNTVEKYCTEIYDVLGCPGGRPELMARALRGEFGDVERIGKDSV